MRCSVLPLHTLQTAGLFALAVLAGVLVACDVAPPVRSGAPTTLVPTTSPDLAFTYRDIVADPSTLPTPTAPHAAWPHNPGSDPPPPLEIISPSNAASLRPLLRLGLGTPSAVAFDAAGDRLAVGTRTGLISIYTVPSGTTLQRWQAADREIMAFGFTGDGSHLLVGDAGGRLSIWNPASASAVASFDTGIRNPRQITFAPDRPAAAILSHDPVANRSDISIWDPLTGFLRHRRSSVFPVTALGIAPDGASFAIGESDGTVEILPVSGGISISSEPLHDGLVHAVSLVDAASPRYISASAGRVRLRGYGLTPELSGWDAGARTAAIATSRDGRIVLTGDFTGRVTLSNLKNATVNQISGLHQDRVVAVALDRSGARAATAGLDGTVALWPTTDPTLPLLLPGYHSPMVGLRFSNDSTLIASHSDDTRSIWNTVTATSISPILDSAIPVPGELPAPETALAQSPALGLTATGGPDGLVTIFRDANESTPVRTLAFRGSITHLAFGAAGTLLVVDGDGLLHRADVFSGTITPISPPVPGAVVAITARPDSARAAVALVSADSLGTLALLDLTRGRWTVINRFSGFVPALAASDRFEIVFGVQTSVNGPAILTLHRSRNGELLAALPSPSYQSLAIALSPDGRLLATAGPDGAIWLWGVPAG